MPFSGLAPSKLKKKIRVGYVYIEESFDTIFNMGYGGGLQDPPPSHEMKEYKCGNEFRLTYRWTAALFSKNRNFT